MVGKRASSPQLEALESCSRDISSTNLSCRAETLKLFLLVFLFSVWRPPQPGAKSNACNSQAGDARPEGWSCSCHLHPVLCCCPQGPQGPLLSSPLSMRPSYLELKPYRSSLHAVPSRRCLTDVPAQTPSQPAPRTVGAPTDLGMLLGSWCCDAGTGCSLPPWP